MKRGGVDTTKKITSSQEYLHLTERAKKSPISDLADFEKFRNLKAENQMQALQEVRRPQPQRRRQLCCVAPLFCIALSDCSSTLQQPSSWDD